MTSTAVKTDPLVIGVVRSLKDPLHLGRVQVAFPHLHDQLSDWARLVCFMAGRGRGALFRPEVGDEVLVGLLQGDPRQPYVLGALWNEVDPPPEDGGETANDLRTIRSRAGHVVRFDDGQNRAKVEVHSASGALHVVLDDANNRVEVVADSGNVVVQAGGDLTVAARGRLTLRGATVEVSATRGDTTVRGTRVHLNP